MLLKVLLLTACLTIATSSAKPSVDKFIINGTLIDPKEHKHLVLIYRLCTGSILTDSWVISAAHCFISRSDSYDIYHYHGGLQSRKHHKIATAVYEDVVINPGYNQGNLTSMDMALIKTQQIIELNKYVQPIPLATVPPRVGQSAVIAGFGSTQDGNNEDFPLAYTGPVTIAQCAEGKAILCTRGFTKTYFGDSGGPLVSNGQLIGTTIGLNGSNYVYLSVPANIKWIRKVIKS